MEKQKYYITTAIAYTSAKPHIGNTYEIVLTDAIARYKRLAGYDVFFQTGTDEHGQKIEEKAHHAGLTPQQFVDGIAGIIKENFDLMNTSYDQFVRTSDPAHKLQVQKIFKRLYEQGDIYKGEYSGKYCVPCESFWTESQLEDGKCPDCGREVQDASEEAYFFNLGKYAQRLVDHIEANPEFIQPESRKNEMINNFIKPGLQDLCVSRTSFKWGIPVDFDPGHVVYVWIDALSNYITGLDFDMDGNHGPRYHHYWPADVHVIGKDILRFHTIYWPIMLMALDIPLPKQVFGHPWLLVGDGKMSKSKGNAIYADDLVKHFGVDAVRYYLLHEMPFANDGTITYELVMERINSDLANVLGNLVSRTISMSNKYFEGTIHNTNVRTPLDEELIQLALATPGKVEQSMEHLKVGEAIEHINILLRRCNKYIDETTPWTLGKDPEAAPRLHTVLYNLLESIRFAGVLLQAFLPESATAMLDALQTEHRDFASLQQFGNLESSKVIEKAPILFARIDSAALLAELSVEAVAEEENETCLPEIGIDHFSQVEMKVGEILSCEKHPKADKLLVSQVSLGSKTVQIVSGIASAYAPSDLVGKKVVVVTNLKPAKLRGVESQGMILASGEGKDIAVVSIDAHIPAGTLIK
ncbi:MAG: methionine--tRNA ligase [Erysipelotrichaceae bacterium]